MISHFFIDRPIFATVLSIVIVIVGVVALTQLPIAQYPDVAPPTVQVTATYPGANAKTVADTVATPIEQEVNGVERHALHVVEVHERRPDEPRRHVRAGHQPGHGPGAGAEPRRGRRGEAARGSEAHRRHDEEEVAQHSAVRQPDLGEDDPTAAVYYDQLYLSNFATLSVKDDLARIKGVGDVAFLGPRDYSMRVWLDPDKLAARDLTASDVINAVREQNRQVAAGRLGQPPVPAGQSVQFQLPINTPGRLNVRGAIRRHRSQDERRRRSRSLQGRRPRIGRKTPMVAPLAKASSSARRTTTSTATSTANHRATLAVFQLPGSNALDTAEAIRTKMDELKSRFPEGVDYRIVLRHHGVRR